MIKTFPLAATLVTLASLTASARIFPGLAQEKPLRAGRSEAENAVKKARVLGGLTLFGNDGKPLPCPLQHTDVRAEISGFISRVTVEQTFHNPATGVVEALYTFPLPSDSAVDEMTMTVGARRIVGQIKRKEEARKIYQAAKSEGKTAALLDQERPNIFTQSVANILPGQDVKVRISYVNLLKYEEGRYEWTFPTVVGPRYTATGGYNAPAQRGAPSTPPPDGSAGEIESVERDANKITPPITPEGTRAGHDLSLQIDLDAGVPLGEIHSVLHPVTVQKIGATRAKIALRDGATLPNQDFVLRFRTAERTVQTGLLTHTDGRGGFFTLFFQPPPAPKPSQIAPRELIFAIDQTGSQEGWPIEKAKETMKEAMRALRPGDTFNLLGFDTEVHPCFRASVPATAANIALATRFLAGIDAGGGTDILKSVAYILKQPYDPKRLRIVCYLTDGFVGNDMQTIDYIRKNRGTTRIFPFGIGNSVNRFFIENMAKEGRGFAQVVTLQEKGDEAAQKFIDRIARPVLLDPQINFGGLPVTDTNPNPLPDLYADGPLVVSGRFTHAAQGKIVVSGIAGGREWQQQVAVNFPEDQPGNSALPSLWARGKIEGYQAQDWLGAQNGNPDAQIKEKIVQTALDYRLMSQYTSFVAVEERIVNPGGAQTTLDTPVEMAKGVAYAGIFGRKSEQEQRAQAASRYALLAKNGSAPDFAARPGDPLIRIDAPRDARRVVAIFPNGEVKTLVFNSQSQGWEAHFDIPTNAAEGKYHVSIIVVHASGARQRFGLNFSVDMTGPQGAGRLNRRGNSLQLQLEASEGLNRVCAFLPWGERVELKLNGPRFEAKTEVPAQWSASNPQVRFVLTDNAHNRTEVLVDWN